MIERDPADDRVLEGAAEGSADVIVSGDRHLLQLRRWEEIRIVRAADLLRERSSDRRQGPDSAPASAPPSTVSA